MKFGIIGTGRIAGRMLQEMEVYPEIEVAGVYNPHPDSAERFAKVHTLDFWTDKLTELWPRVDAVYIASPHPFHADYAEQALTAGKHVLCEKPMTLCGADAERLFALASKQDLVLMEAIKTAFCPAFLRLCETVKSGAIGEVRAVDVRQTIWKEGNIRELDPKLAGGSVTEVGTYVLLPIVKLLGHDTVSQSFTAFYQNQIDVFTECRLQYASALATFTVGMRAKTDDALVVTGTKGFIRVPAPWWKPTKFTVGFEDSALDYTVEEPFEGTGLRYELKEFLARAQSPRHASERLTAEDSIFLAYLMEHFLNGVHVEKIELPAEAF